MKNYKGFTLSEVMVTLGVLGVLAAILIPAVVNVSPDKSKVLFKKAYYATEKAVSTIISSDLYYPATSTGTTTDTGLTVGKGFNNTDTTSMGIPAGNNKFCYLMSEYLNTVTANCTAGTVDTIPPYTFTTTDGVVWTFTASAFALDSDDYLTTEVLKVDTSGEAAPNCTYANPACLKPDQFKIRIRYDGKMTIDPTDVVAKAILLAPTDNKKN